LTSHSTCPDQHSKEDLFNFTIMKKLVKKQKSLLDRRVNLSVDERLSKLDMKALSPKKLAEANKHLKKMKSLPK